VASALDAPDAADPPDQPDPPGSPLRPRPSIETRLIEAGLPPLRRTAWIEIDTDALAANVAVLRRMAGPGIAILPVVKADAYGHGMVPIARALAAAGADGLCVATLDEAIVLRDAGVAAPLLVLYPVPPSGVADAEIRPHQSRVNHPRSPR